MVRTRSRLLRRTTRIAAALAAVFALLLGAATVWNQAALVREALDLPEYGRFGYGLSDPTDTPRTAERIVTEMHTAVAGLGAQRYALMGHSIGGIYGLKWAELFGDELTAFIGIDSSVPDQANMDTRFPTGLMALARFTGIARLAADLSGDGLDPSIYDDQTRRDMALLSNRNALAPTYLDEMRNIAPTFRAAAGATFPPTLPLLLFAQAGENPGQPNWIPLHEEQAASVEDGELVLLPGSHYLHHTHAAEIAAQTGRSSTRGRDEPRPTVRA